MITFGRYEAFLAHLAKSGILSSQVGSIPDTGSGVRLFAIKHDVEDRLPVALKVARLEEAYGHKATFYFQGDLLLDKDADIIIRQIAEMGHEVGLHYDVLDAHEGDYVKAAEEFEHYLGMLQDYAGTTVVSVCPHGNPTKVRNGWRSNKDFFKNSHIRERYRGIIDIVVDFPKLMPRGLYISDAGFKLRKIANISSNDASNQCAMDDGRAIGWGDVARLAELHEGVVLSVHPHRLRDSQIWVLLMRGRMKVLRAGYRLTRNIPGVKYLANRYYAISRRF